MNALRLEQAILIQKPFVHLFKHGRSTSTKNGLREGEATPQDSQCHAGKYPPLAGSQLSARGCSLATQPNSLSDPLATRSAKAACVSRFSIWINTCPKTATRHRPRPGNAY